MSLENELINLERRFWTEGAAFYRGHVDDKCLLVFNEMTGMKSRDEIADMVKEEPRWRDLRIDPVGVIEVDDKAAILTYRAQAVHAGTAETYRAVVSSMYVKRGADWKLAFHQQSPQQPPAQQADRFPKQEEKDIAGGQHGTRNIGGSRPNPGRTH